MLSNLRDAFLIVLLSFAAGQAMAATRHVGSGCTYAHVKDAVAGAPAQTKIAIAPGNYAEDHLQIADGTLVLQGATDCSSETPTGGTTMLKAANGGSVLSIRGVSVVTLKNLTLTGGHGVRGGGIDFDGAGQLTLYDVVVSGNSATTGGGIGLHGSTGSILQLNLFAGSLIYANYSSENGGGLYADGNSRVVMVEAQTAIAYNTAYGLPAGTGYGGGAYVVGPARVEIGSPGYDHGDSYFPAVSHNQGKFGAGVAVVGGAQLRFYSTTEGTPVGIESNGSSGVPFVPDTQKGGGILALGAGTGVCGWHYRVNGNTGGDGAAIATADGAVVSLFRRAVQETCVPSLNVDVFCLTGQRCNSIDGNVAANTIVSVGTNALVTADGLSISHNRSDGWLVDVGSSMQLTSCLVADNDVLNDLFYKTAPLNVRSCTIAGLHTRSNGHAVFGGPGDLLLAAGIVQYFGYDLVTRNDAHLVISAVIAHEIGSAHSVPGAQWDALQLGDPAFIDPGAGNYRLGRRSDALDWLYPEDVPVYDVDGTLRCAPVYSQTHACDLGAYESNGDFLFFADFDPIPN